LLGCDCLVLSLAAVQRAGTGPGHQARAGQQRPGLPCGRRAACSWKRPAYALDAPPIEVRARRWWIGAGFPTGCSPGTTRRTRPGDGALDATARRRARVWEGARGRDSVAWDVAAGAGAPGRPPGGSRGLPPHAPASWQEAWVFGRSSARRRSAWRLDYSLGTRQSPSPSPSASAARNGRTHRSDSRRWPLSPPNMRRSEAHEATGKLCPGTPEVNETAHE
jgi:hypothetical protein